MESTIKTITKGTGRKTGAYERPPEPRQTATRPAAPREPAFAQTASRPAASRQTTANRQTVSNSPGQSAYRQTAPQRPAPRRRKKKSAAGPIAIICVLALVIALGAGYVLYMKNLADTDHIFPNVMVSGVNVGGMTKEEAANAIHAAVDGQYERNTLLVKLPDRTLELTPDLTHVSIDVDAVVDLAWNYGREGNFWQVAKAYRQAESNSYLIDINDAITLDTSAVRELIDRTAAEVASSLIRTQVQINQTAGTITITQGTPGRVLDADALYEAVLRAYAENNFTTLTMDYVEQQPDPVNLLSIYDEYCYEPVDATYDPATGKITQSKEGLSFDFEKENAIVANLAAGQTYTIQMNVIKPSATVDSLADDLFQDVLAEYSSPYVWNPARTTNLTLACQEIDGTILAPGDVFSFNKIVGERTEARGFQPAAVYVGIETADEVGGGVCQVASTIYNCALMSNLEIVERTEHRYLVTYVEKGMDATIYWGQLDFKFKNTTDYPLKILANTDNNCVNIQFLGTNVTGEYARMTFEILGSTDFEDEIEVDLEQPPEYEEQTQSPYRGFEIQTYRHVYNAEGKEISVTKEEHSIYAMRNRIITVGYGNPRIPDDYEYPEGTVFPKLPEPPAPGVDTRPGEDDPVDNPPDDPDIPDDPDDPGFGYPTDPTEPDPGDDDGGFEISGDG